MHGGLTARMGARRLEMITASARKRGFFHKGNESLGLLPFVGQFLLFLCGFPTGKKAKSTCLL